MGDRDMNAFVINLAERTDRMDLFRENKLPFEVKRFDAIKTDQGWIGCTQSHFSILQIYDELPLLILEDDVLFTEPWSVVEEAMRQLPDDWDALWLGATLCIPQERYSENLFRLIGGVCCHAIIYNSKRMIDYIITNHVEFFNTCLGRPTIDVFYCDDVQRKFNCFLTFPYVATQRAGYSDIEKAGVDYFGIINNPNLFNHASE